MVREPGPQGRELRYPVTVSFSGNADDLRAEVAADAAYPLEHGGTTPLEYRATFRGRARDGELRMQSERVQVRLVEFDRTETVPQQELSARLEGGVLRGTVTSPGQQPSHFELRSEDGDVRTADERPGEVPSAEAPPDPGNRPARPGTTAYPTLVLERREIVDPQMGGIVSHMLSVPRGWLFEGGARWTGNPDHIVDFVGELRGPDGESVVFVRDRQFRYARAHSQVGVFDETDGRTFPDGATARHAPQQPGEVAVEVLLAELRPGAGAVRLVQAERVPALEEALRALLKPQLDMIQALIDQSRRQPMPGMNVDSRQWLVVERARVRYREGGTEWEEELQYSLMGFHGVVASDAMRSENGAWTLGHARTARAKAGQLDARLGALWLCADSLREAPRWSAAVNAIRLEVAKAKTEAMRNGNRIRFEEIRRRGEELAKTRAELSDMQMQTWRAQQDSLDRVQKARVDAIGERQDFRAGDGNVYTTTNHYDRAFRESNGALILTNDPDYRPSADPAFNRTTWEELQRVDPFRR